MRFIYRVEDKDGNGPYRFGSKLHFEIKKMEVMHSRSGDSKHPHVMEEFKRCSIEGEISGFLTRGQVRRWFTYSELKMLKQHGFTLKKIIVAEVTAVGQTQILAKRLPKRSFAQILKVLARTN